MLSRFFLDRPVFAWVIAIIMMVREAWRSIIAHITVSAYRPAVNCH